MRRMWGLSVALVGALMCAGCSSSGAGSSLGLEKLDVATSGLATVTVSPAEESALTAAVVKSEDAPVTVAKKASSKSSSGSSSSKTSAANSTADSPFRRDMSSSIKTPGAP